MHLVHHCDLCMYVNDRIILDHHPFLVQGKWTTSPKWNTIVDPLNGESFIKVSEVDETGIKVHDLVIANLLSCVADGTFAQPLG